MTEHTLPPLPEPWTILKMHHDQMPVFTAEQMKTYALAALSAPAEGEELREGLGQIAVRVKDDPVMLRCCRMIDEILALRPAAAPVQPSEPMEKLARELWGISWQYRREEGVARMAEHLRAALSTPAGWQPIETAPKDAHVLLWVDIAIGAPLIVQACWFEVDPSEKGWIDANGETVEATHWMPLPAPPAQPLPQGKETP